jgi:hypothetical protein
MQDGKSVPQYVVDQIGQFLGERKEKQQNRNTNTLCYSIHTKKKRIGNPYIPYTNNMGMNV